MRAFLMAMPHRSAMGKLAEWCDEASVGIGIRKPPRCPHGMKPIEEWSRRAGFPSSASFGSASGVPDPAT